MKNHTRIQTDPRRRRRLPASIVAAAALACLAAPGHAGDQDRAGAANSAAAADHADRAAAADHADHAGSGGCFPVHGSFAVEALPDEDCQSPAGRCTAGHLTGRLRGAYGFVLESLIPTPVPDIFFYSGTSRLVLRDGSTLTGIDTATIDFDPARFGTFVTTITLTEATGSLAGATGQLVLDGRLDFLGGGSGKYHGRICPAD